MAGDPTFWSGENGAVRADFEIGATNSGSSRRGSLGNKKDCPMVPRSCAGPRPGCEEVGQ